MLNRCMNKFVLCNFLYYCKVFGNHGNKQFSKKTLNTLNVYFISLISYILYDYD